MQSTRRRAVRGIAVATVLSLGSLSLFVGPVSASGLGGNWHFSVGHVVRSLAHVIGIVGGLAILYFADNVRRQTKGSTMERSSVLVEVGTGLFVLTFLGMELVHGFGFDLWYFADELALTQTYWMIGLAGVALTYALAYRHLAREIGTWFRSD